MKLLIDTCVSALARPALESVGHDVVWAGDWESDPGDTKILEAARTEARILITLDKDFGELAVAFGQRHTGIVRLVDIRPEHQATICQQVLARYGAEIELGAIATVTRARVRIRPPDPVDSGSESSGV